MDMRRADITGDSAENIKAWAGATKVKINMAHMVLDLPAKIQELEDQLQHKQAELAKMKASQEGGTI